MAVDNFNLRVAINEIEGQQSDMALRWVMLKMWLDKQEAAQQSVQSDLPTRCPECEELTVYGSSCHNALCSSASR